MKMQEKFREIPDYKDSQQILDKLQKEKSGYFEEKKDITVGVDLEPGLDREYGNLTETVTGIIKGNYIKGVPDGDLTVCFQGKVWGGNDIGWENCSYTYIGNLKDNSFFGNGELYQNETLIYRGEFENGQYNGQGIFYWDNGTPFIKAKFSNGIFDGMYTMYDYDTGTEISI